MIHALASMLLDVLTNDSDRQTHKSSDPPPQSKETAELIGEHFLVLVDLLCLLISHGDCTNPSSGVTALVQLLHGVLLSCRVEIVLLGRGEEGLWEGLCSRFHLVTPAAPQRTASTDTYLAGDASKTVGAGSALQRLEAALVSLIRSGRSERDAGDDGDVLSCAITCQELLQKMHREVQARGPFVEDD